MPLDFYNIGLGYFSVFFYKLVTYACHYRFGDCSDSTNDVEVIFHKKLRIWASTRGFLKLSDFQHSEFLTSFLKVP